ncbi:hypothetical protein Dsin_016060 [Dipteronia sinensis]|uniref:Patellin-3 n=1 Tax=Dipteronia sinensis TaxID=43782 RepID=A0AAE0E597_9ROSI|nr:hypothetical protein Dsin_016060 [Dipteronia sinensis]
MADQVQNTTVAQETLADVPQVQVDQDQLVVAAVTTTTTTNVVVSPQPDHEDQKQQLGQEDQKQQLDQEDQKQQLDQEAPLKELINIPSTTDRDDAEKKNIIRDDNLSSSFKEETSKVADLSDNEKKALEELTQLVREALNKHEFSATSLSPPKEEEQKKLPSAAVAVAVISKEKQEIEEKSDSVVTDTTTVVVVEDDGAKTVEAIEETIVAVSAAAKDEKEDASCPEKLLKLEADEKVSIWGIPLLVDERSDVILLKFLRARDFKVKDSFSMLKNTIKWRKEFGIEELVDEDLGDDLKKVVFMHGFDKHGHPVCYNVYGEFQNKEVYQNAFSDEAKRERFLRWRIQFLERSIRKLDFTPGGISTIVQVNDLKNSPGLGKWELRQATKHALQLLQDNYPEFVAKQVFINVPWWYLAVNRMISPFLTQRTRSKFVFAGPSKSAETLFRYIAAEQVPVKYGGLSKDGEIFEATDAVTEITVKPAAKHAVEFPVTEACHLSWEVRVVGWDVKYGAEFVPSSEESYTVIIQKARKVGSSEEAVVCDSFKIGEAGKVVLTIENPTSKKKKLFYRSKTKPNSSACQTLCC